MTTNIQELLKYITSDLKLNVPDQLEFENQFGQLFILNLLLDVPSKYKEGIEGLLQNETLPNPKSVSEKLVNLGVDKNEAYKILDESIRKTLSEVMHKY